MASETLGADNSREKRRWGENNKVYTRRIHKKGLKTSTDATVTDAVAAENVTQQSFSQTLATEDANSLKQRPEQVLSQIEVVSDVSSSHDRLPQEAAPNGGEVPNGNGAVKPVVTRVGDRVKINLDGATSKKDIRELRKKFVGELDQVRGLVKKLEEVKELQLTQNSANEAIERRDLVRVHSDLHSANEVIEKRALVRVHSEVGSVGRHDSRPFRQLSVSVIENNYGVGEFVEKEKRTPKANQFYRNSDFLLGKDRLPHRESNKKPKSNGGKKHGGMEFGFRIERYRSQIFKSCSNLLQKLMKHKYGWVFNEPVNAKALELHDYHDIIKHPMDLGTVKSRLGQNFYKSAREFAEDVRLTFHNAMRYNPKGQDVHVIAEQMLNLFEERWAVIEAEQLSNIFEERWAIIEAGYNPDWRYEMIHDSGLPTPTSRKSAPQMRAFDRSESMTTTVDSRLKSSNFAPVGRTPVPKKPKAKDLNKRDMTYEEKQKLSTNLQSLPSEKLDSIVQIIKKRNSTVSQHEEEIEVDIDRIDAETLWELDRFVTNYKKSLSKYKRKAEIALQKRTEAARAIQPSNPGPAIVEAPKESKKDEKLVATSPVQGEKQGDNVSISSSSSSSSSDSGSSSSDSDSDSSSADGSDAGHSPRT